MKTSLSEFKTHIGYNHILNEIDQSKDLPDWNEVVSLGKEPLTSQEIKFATDSGWGLPTSDKWKKGTRGLSFPERLYVKPDGSVCGMTYGRGYIRLGMNKK